LPSKKNCCNWAAKGAYGCCYLPPDHKVKIAW